MDFHQLEDWPISIQDMNNYYDIAEQIMNVSNRFTDGAPFTEILLKRLHQNEFLTANKVPIAANLYSSVYGQGPSDVFYSSMISLAKALNHRPFDLAVNARAIKVLAPNRHVTGVKVVSPYGRVYVLKAKTVVLSTSTFETPRLLLHSGIQGRAIGHYLTNHSFVSAMGSINRKEFPEELGTLGIVIPSSQYKPYQIQLRGPKDYFWYQPYQEKPLLDELVIDFLCFGAVESRFDNKITLNPYKRDEYGVPEIQVHFSYSDKDLSIISQIDAAVHRISSAAGIRLISRNGRPSICLMPPGELHHDSSTCRIGTDPATSATDQYGRIHGYKGLYIADNSVLPSVGGENPTLTTVALAIHTADHIIREVKLS
jgi:choline dehydrogenase-like flavoprotein